ncbi:DUF6221 family protein [Streptomyces sp. NPDC050597]|uniref:DUF6221 family protein n=1 Tax=Streptomyces sp. NPDC050597 TaxID=3157212 RepID=UPI00343FD805
MIELIRWLGEQFDEDERVARAVTTPGTWRVGSSHGGSTVEGEGWTVDNADALDGAHIATHDPARVLLEIDAKRDLLRFAEGIHDHHETFTTGIAARLEKTLRLYALAYAARPGYRGEWKP